MNNLTRATLSGLDTTSPAFSLTRELLRLCPGLANDETEAVQAVIMAVLVAEQEGHTHLLLSEGATSGSLTQALQMVISPDAPPETAERISRAVPGLLRDSRLSTLIGKPGEHKPLILEGDILASHRSHLQEHHLNQLLLTRLESVEQATAPSVQHSSFATLMTRLSEEQRAAVQVAGQRLLTVISGGPGTGKTSIVSALIAHLCSRGMKPSEIGLAAPTGKAANRLEQAIQNSWPALQIEDSPLAGHLPPTGMTLHRLIGAGRKAGRFSFHSGNPLPLKAVIVDEASMIDLSMMHNLLQALSPTCRLVLLGDADQLPAVENGAVFRDLVAPPEFQGKNPPWCARLTKSFRMREDDPQGSAILRLASFIRDGHEFPLGPDQGRSPNAPATCRTRCHEITGKRS